LQNIKYDLLLDNSGVIFRVNPVDGSPSNNNPFLAEKNDSKGASIAKYHAYGIRNSFGIDFDPITVKLWDAENGQDLYDEINMVDQDLIAAGNWLWDLFQDRRE
jgi:glucose/arabinose dehydrogenase